LKVRQAAPYNESVPRDERPDRDPEADGLHRESPTETEGPEAATEGFAPGQGPLVVGRTLGERYQVVGRLGAGGMGEVWRAFDLKLRVEVALKALREDLFKDEKRLEMLRQEVRAAREVVSPNVCRIFDLVEADGRELVSMEYVDGQTLLEVLQERGPLELKEAQEAARFPAPRPTWRRSRRPGCGWTRGRTCTRRVWCWPRW
jgi:hypothetical protein